MRAPGIGRLLALSILIVTASTQPVFLLGAGFLQTGPEFGFGTAGLGLLTALFFLVASAASTPLGRVVERTGFQKALRFNAVASSVLMILIAAFARNVWTLALLLGLSAAVYGVSNPAANLALASYVNPRHRALIFGLKLAGIPASTLLAGLAVPIVMLELGWRASYLVGAAVALGVVLLIPRGQMAPPPQDWVEDPRRWVEPLTTGGLVALGAGAAMATMAAVALSSFLVPAAVENGFSESAAGLLLFAGSVVSITARVVAGATTDRAGGRGFGTFAILTAVGSVVFLLLPAATAALFGTLVLAAFASGWAWPGIMTYTVVNANLANPAASSAITQTGVFVGAGVSPIVIGLVARQWSFDIVWVVVAVLLALTSVVVGVLGRRCVARTRLAAAPRRDRPTAAEST